MEAIRIVQYFALRTYASSFNWRQPDNSNFNKDRVYNHYYQNFFVGETKEWNGHGYAFAPFRAEGTMSSLGGDNPLVQVLFPNVEVAIRFVEQGNGNRLSRLTLSTVWLNAALNQIKAYEERYVGVGASFSDTTIELRFRSAMDSVGAQFPARKLSRSNVGILPLSADISLR
jgi:hypothetical protein